MDVTTISLILGALLGISELLSLIPSVKSNGVFQMFWNTFKILAGQKNKEV
ncbi:hypothetical protein ES702_05650 [subsurface metagenome]